MAGAAFLPTSSPDPVTGGAAPLRITEEVLLFSFRSVCSLVSVSFYK